MFRNKYLIVAVGVILIAFTVLHALVARNLAQHVLLEELYYIPIFLAALRFGLKGALLTYLFTSLLYLSFFFGHWILSYMDLIDRILHLTFSGLFAFVAGYLIDRERRLEKQEEQDRSLRASVRLPRQLFTT